MKRTSLFGHVSELLDCVRSTERPTDGVVRDFFRTRHYLGSKDRRFITDSLYGILRNFKLLEVYVNEAHRKIEPAPASDRIQSIAYCAAYHLKVQGDSVDGLTEDLSGLWRVFAPSVDCEDFLVVLSSVELPSSISSDPVRSLAVNHSFPESIVAEWMVRYGGEETESLCKSLNQSAPITVRVNTLRVNVEECQHALLQEGIKSERTNLSQCGLILEKRVNTQSMLSFKKGWFEMQDEGSQLLSLLTEPSPGHIIIDACAGGGGKTLHLAALMNNSGELIAIDVEDRRLANILQRTQRAGASIVKTYLADKDKSVLHSYKSMADAVLIDAPCSGVGTFRRNPGMKLTFSDSFVEKVSRTQHRVLEIYTEFVRPGGRLVYTTCTLVRKENEDAIEWFLATHPEFFLLSAPEILARQGVSVDSTSPYLTLMTHRTSTDTFFGAVMERKR